MLGMLTISLCDEDVALLPSGALWLAGRSALLVADAHLGKAHSFRRLGVPVPAGTTDAVLQAIALENNLSETAFLVNDASGEADYELRWFTPAAEVVLCGHATLASGHYLLEAYRARDRVTFRTRKAGLLSVARPRRAMSSACRRGRRSPSRCPRSSPRWGSTALFRHCGTMLAIR